MDRKSERHLLVEEYRSFASILHQKGISFDILSDEELQKIPIQDLSRIVRSARDLARTPTS